MSEPSIIETQATAIQQMQEQIAHLQLQLVANQQQAQTTTSEIAQVNTVSIKYPPFWSTDIDLWFNQLESQFTLAKVTLDSTKFHHLVSAIDKDALKLIADVLRSTEPSPTYAILKKTLLDRCLDSEDQRIKKLLSNIELGDKRPSQLLRDMQALAGPNTANNIIRQLWMQRLPTSMQAVLQTTMALDLNRQAEVADKIAEVSQPNILTCSTSLPKSSEISPLVFEIAELRREFAETCRKLENTKKHIERPRSFSPRPHRRSDSRSKSRNRREDSVDRHSWCWYHRIFSRDATRCRSPCSYNETSQKN